MESFTRVPMANDIIPPTTTLPRMLEQTVATHPARTALLYFGSRITYGQLLEQANCVAAGLQALGIEKGDRVVLMMPNCPQFVIGYFGALRAGAIVTGTNAIYTPREVTHQWNDAGAKLVIADRRCFPVIKAAQPQLTTVRQVVLTGMRHVNRAGAGKTARFALTTAPIRAASSRKYKMGGPSASAAIRNIR